MATDATWKTKCYSSVSTEVSQICEIYGDNGLARQVLLGDLMEVSR